MSKMLSKPKAMSILVAGLLVTAQGAGAAEVIRHVPRPAAPVVTASAASAMPAQLPVTVSDAGPSLSTTAVVRAPTVEIPACGRKVKLIYAGYGEADRAAC